LIRIHKWYGEEWEFRKKVEILIFKKSGQWGIDFYPQNVVNISFRRKRRCIEREKSGLLCNKGKKIRPKELKFPLKRS